MDFYADWCAACKKLEGLTFTHDQVLPKLKQMTLIRIDCTKSSDLLVDIQARFLIRGLPTVVLIDAHGDVQDQARVTGFMEAKPFLERLKMLDRATAP
jgi:thiol:disulfide interchange protein DsbD